MELSANGKTMVLSVSLGPACPSLKLLPAMLASRTWVAHEHAHLLEAVDHAAELARLKLHARLDHVHRHNAAVGRGAADAASEGALEVVLQAWHGHIRGSSPWLRSGAVQPRATAGSREVRSGATVRLLKLISAAIAIAIADACQRVLCSGKAKDAP